VTTSPEKEKRSTYHYSDGAIVNCLLALEDDDDAETVARACDCLGSIARDVGWAFLRHFQKRLIKRVRRLMMDRALCNRKADALSWQTSQDLYTSVSHMLCAFSSSWATYAEAEAVAAANNKAGPVPEIHEQPMVLVLYGVSCVCMCVFVFIIYNVYMYRC
jgi:hypothetical protein